MAKITLSENNNQHHINISVDDIIQIELDESPTSGYKWELAELDTSDMDVMSEDFKPNINAAIGGSGKKIIQLKAIRKSTGTIKLQKYRSWDSNVHKTFEIFYS